jgi:hypothetical protein
MRFEEVVSRSVERATYGFRPLVENVGIDHRGADVLMAEKLLDGTDVVAGFEEMGSEAVAESMAAGGFGDPSGSNGRGDGPLQRVLVDVVASDLPGTWIGGAAFRGEDILPAPLTSRAWVLSLERVREVDGAEAVAQIGVMKGSDTLEVSIQGIDERFGQEGHAILAAFPPADDDLKALEIDIFDAKPHALHETEAGAVEKVGQKTVGALEVRQDGADFLTREHDGKGVGGFGFRDSLETFGLAVEDMAVEEEDGAERLILSRGADFPLDGKVTQEGDDVGRVEFARVAAIVEDDEASDPIDVGTLGADTVVAHAEGGSNLFQEPGLLARGGSG